MTNTLHIHEYDLEPPSLLVSLALQESDETAAIGPDVSQD